MISSERSERIERSETERVVVTVGSVMNGVERSDHVSDEGARVNGVNGQGVPEKKVPAFFL